MTREEAIKIIESNCSCTDSKLREACAMFIPELAESEDERIRKIIRLALIASEDELSDFYKVHNIRRKECTDWLEKQKEKIEKEYVFRPLAGTDIKIAAEQAIRRAMEGDRLVLAFNGWYIRVDKYATTEGLVDGYYAFIEKQKEQKQYDIDVLERHITKDSVSELAHTVIVRNGWEIVEGKEQKPVDLRVKGDGVYKICPHCKERMIRDDSKVPTSMPLQHGYRCPKCGTLVFDTVMYDSLTKEEQKPVQSMEEEEFVHTIKELDPNVVIETCTDGTGELDGKAFLYTADKSYQIGFRDGFHKGVESVKPVEWSESFEENIRILLHDKLTWHSEDGKMSSTVLIDDKTLKDIVSGIWFYVGKEALKYPSKKLNVSEWSKVDKNRLEEAIEMVEANGCWVRSDDAVKQVSDFLKSLPERFALQRRQEWSKEDEKNLELVIDCIYKFYPDPAMKYKLKEWLKFLRPHWKPSEEQMGALNYAYCELFKREDVGHNILSPLQNLIDTLPKL